MKATVVYVLPVGVDERSFPWAIRFLETYQQCPPGLEHDSIVVLNGAKVTSEYRCIFSTLQNCRVIEHDDSGWDIGAFQKAAMQCESDFIVFFGTSVYLKFPGWLIRMAAAVNRFGPSLYGTMGNRGDARVNVWPHVRTTGFWTSPKLMNEYPRRITHHSERYEFEHGKTSFAEWIKAKGMITRVVTRSGFYVWKDWDDIPNGYHRGDQSAMLCGDRLTEPPFYHIR